MADITEELLQDLHWMDFSLMPHNGHLVLILVYEDQAKAEQFLELLRTFPFNVRFISENLTGRHILEIIFLESNFVVRTVFNKTEDNYPVRSRLHLGVNHITTGIRGQNNQILWNHGNMKEIDQTNNFN